MPRVGQFVSFTSAVAVGMFTLGAMLLLLSQGSGNQKFEAIVLVTSLGSSWECCGLHRQVCTLQF